MASSGNILIIEDDHETRVTLRQCLEREGYFVISATNGAAALELLAQMTPPDAILLDINMPIMNGDEFLNVLRTKRELSAVPVIQMTASTAERREGVSYSLNKPLDLNELLEVLKTCPPPFRALRHKVPAL